MLDCSRIPTITQKLSSDLGVLISGNFTNKRVYVKVRPHRGQKLNKNHIKEYQNALKKSYSLATLKFVPEESDDKVFTYRSDAQFYPIKFWDENFCRMNK